MKIATRLAAGFSLLIILFLLCTGIALHALLKARDDMDNAVNNKMYRYNLIQDMRSSARDISVAVRNIALLTDEKEKQPEWDRLMAQKEKIHTEPRQAGYQHGSQRFTRRKKRT